MTEWRTMESAPKDGTHMLAAGPDFDGVRVIAWGKASHIGWHAFCLADQGAENFDPCSPTHWMPLPEPPK